VHWVVFPDEHWPQEPPGWQAGADAETVHSLSEPHARHVRNAWSHTGVAPPQSVFARQPTHTFVEVLQTGVAPEQLLLERHCTHDAVGVSQMGVAPPHRPMFVAEQALHAPDEAPDVWHAGAVAGHWLSAVHGPQVCVAVAQMGVVPEQFASEKQATQTRGDAVVRQYGVEPLQSEFDVHFSTNTLVVCWPEVALSPSDGKSCASAPDTPEAFTFAWFEMLPSAVESTVTRNTTVVASLGAIVPPVVPFAPVPRRTFTVRVAETYSP
jgi:hypothetical protein